MLPAKENELLTRVGPGAAMGDMLRQYWWPVLRTDRLEAGGAPVRVRLMGEDLVAFRSPDGRTGVLDERCPHRSVSLMLARNEECGLRCILHGWLISPDGKVLETPNEKEAGERLSRLRVRHLPSREAGGMLWVWAGKDEPAEFPNYAFNHAADSAVMFGLMKCNWFQALETLWDPAHVAILHAQGRTFRDQFEGVESALAQKMDVFYAADCESRDEPFGFSYRFTEGVGSGGGLPLWTPTAMPSWVYITAAAENPYGDRVVIGHVPVDDETMLLVQIYYNMESKLGLVAERGLVGIPSLHNFVPQGHTRDNNWSQDREAMNVDSFTGIGYGMSTAGIFLQDAAVMESAGAIVDRTRENIGPADHGIVKGRQVYLAALKAFQDGKGALGANIDLSQVGVPGGAEYKEQAA